MFMFNSDFLLVLNDGETAPLLLAGQDGVGQLIILYSNEQFDISTWAGWEMLIRQHQQATIVQGRTEHSIASFSEKLHRQLREKAKPGYVIRTRMKNTRIDPAGHPFYLTKRLV